MKHSKEDKFADFKKSINFRFYKTKRLKKESTELSQKI